MGRLSAALSVLVLASLGYWACSDTPTSPVESPDEHVSTPHLFSIDCERYEDQQTGEHLWMCEDVHEAGDMEDAEEGAHEGSDWAVEVHPGFFVIQCVSGCPW